MGPFFIGIVFQPDSRSIHSTCICYRVAIDRGLRLAEKRSLPAPNRNHWIETRDKLYDEIQTLVSLPTCNGHLFRLLTILVTFLRPTTKKSNSTLSLTRVLKSSILRY